MNLNDRFHFGKYSKPYAHTLRWVIENDPEYIVWCLENVDWFELDLEADEELERSLERHGFYD